MSNNVLSASAAPLTINGQPLGGTFSFAYDLGGSTADMASQAFNFLSANNQQDQGFLSQSIAGTQGFLSHQVSPYLQAMVGLQNMNANSQSYQQATTANFQSQASSAVSQTSTAYYQNQLAEIQNINSLSSQGITQIGANTANSNAASVQASQSGGGGFCFITTAVCEADGKPDDCEELTILRKFRDEFMLIDSDRKKLVTEYYEIAPSIVSQIKSLPNSGEIFQMLKEDFIIPCIIFIKKGCNHCAMSKYRAMIIACKALLSPVN